MTASVRFTPQTSAASLGARTDTGRHVPPRWPTLRPPRCFSIKSANHALCLTSRPQCWPHSGHTAPGTPSMSYPHFVHRRATPSARLGTGSLVRDRPRRPTTAVATATVPMISAVKFPLGPPVLRATNPNARMQSSHWHPEYTSAFMPSRARQERPEFHHAVAPSSTDTASAPLTTRRRHLAPRTGSFQRTRGRMLAIASPTLTTPNTPSPLNPPLA